MPTMKTKGEVLFAGISKIREGLTDIQKLGDQQDMIKLLMLTPKATSRLKEIMEDDRIFQNLVVSMVSSRNSRLSATTVETIITDFLDVIFDLSQPYQDPESDPHNEKE